MIKLPAILFPLTMLILFSCTKDPVPDGPPVITGQDTIVKPRGIFSASGATSTQVLIHPESRGVLIRVNWKDLEPAEGNFNFSILDNQINAVKSNGKKYSLAVIAGGVGSPDWLISSKGAGFVDYTFRGLPYKLPLIWDNTVQTSLGKLGDKLAAHYNNDTALQLVYVPQMTVNGIEGHLNGVNPVTFTAAGFTETKWIDASLQWCKRLAAAFSKKALAFEVHEIFSSAVPASTILNALWADYTLSHRVGAAIWWISGNNTYQPELLSFLQTWPGDIYGQVIDRSDNLSSFPSGDYTQVFTQARQLRARYIEPWENEFLISNWNSLLHSFNAYADTLKKN